MFLWRPLLTVTCVCLLLANTALSSDCSWSITQGVRHYAFNLGAPLQEYPHGARSEDGSYEVREEGGQEDAVIWFQLCGHMKFNSRPPACQICPKACGTDEHCGETCTALRVASRLGYSKCTAVADSRLANYSLIDDANPALGVAITLSSGDSDGCPSGTSSSLKVKVLCAPNGVMQPPSTVIEEPTGNCQYVTSMWHPSGCPVVTSSGEGGVGWLATLIIILLCGIIVYFAVGLAYRTLVLGVSGYEAIPNLEFWQSLPGTVQSGTSAAITKAREWYHLCVAWFSSRTSGF